MNRLLGVVLLASLLQICTAQIVKTAKTVPELVVVEEGAVRDPRIFNFLKSFGSGGYSSNSNSYGNSGNDNGLYGGGSHGNSYGSGGSHGNSYGSGGSHGNSYGSGGNKKGLTIGLRLSSNGQVYRPPYEYYESDCYGSSCNPGANNNQNSQSGSYPPTTSGSHSGGGYGSGSHSGGGYSSGGHGSSHGGYGSHGGGGGILSKLWGLVKKPSYGGGHSYGSDSYGSSGSHGTSGH